jgi:YVTN family beta-propeller protein
VSCGSYNAPSTISVINTTTNKVTTNVTIGSSPVAIRQFIGGNIQKVKVNGAKTKAYLSKHKHKKHSKHHKIGKNHSVLKYIKNNLIAIPIK